jgi:hypothetical protein
MADAASSTSSTAAAVKTKNEFSVFSYPFHDGAITGVDVCQRKPLGGSDIFCLNWGVNVRVL